METWETSGYQIEFNSQVNYSLFFLVLIHLNDPCFFFWGGSLGDADSNTLILPTKRMRKRKGKEQVGIVEHVYLFIQFACLQFLSEQSSVDLGKWKSQIK